MQFQLITEDTLAGPRQICAPSGWDFDKTQTIVWSLAMSYCREHSDGKKRTQRAAAELKARISALSIVLANSIGMASPYWERQAFHLSTLKPA